MRKLWIIFWLISLTTASAQQSAAFEAPIFFEDGVGNRDTIIVGFDLLATTDMDVEFGEAEILEPFDSIFEVRAGSIFWMHRNKTSKKLIGPAEPVYPLATSHGCFNGPRIFIYIWAKHQPVKISWDSAAFLQDICVRGSLISNHWGNEIIDPYDWYYNPNDKHYCMAEQPGFEMEISANTLGASEVSAHVSIEKEVEGLGVQKIYGLRFFPSPTFTGWTPCSHITTSSWEVEVEKELLVYPNPVTNDISWQLPAGVSVEHLVIYDIQGRTVLEKQQIKQTNISLRQVSSGVYQLVMVGSNGVLYTSRLLKQ